MVVVQVSSPKRDCSPKHLRVSEANLIPHATFVAPLNPRGGVGKNTFPGLTVNSDARPRGQAGKFTGANSGSVRHECAFNR